MKYCLWTILFSLCLASGHGQNMENPASSRIMSDSQIKLVSDCAKTLPENAQLSIALIRNGVADFYGIKNDQDFALSVDNANKVFEIGSITKVFTGTLLASLVLDSKIELEAKINKYLDYAIKDGIELSFVQLATHTSGLPRVPISLSSPTLSLENPYKDYGEEELMNYLTKDLELDTVPGAVSSYSNLGFGLLGYVMGVEEQSTYGRLLRERVFSKYEMNNSSTKRAEIADRLVVGLNDSGEEVSQWDMNVHMGAGGILSTVTDLSKFALAHFSHDNEELELSRTKHFLVTDSFSTGLAWGVIKMDSGSEWLWHNGGTGGYTSSMILDIEAKNGVIILSNISALGELTNNITGLAPALLKSIQNRK